MKENPDYLLLFDGVCNLCNGLVQFVIRNDKKGKFRFASLQSEYGQEVLKKFNLSSAEFDSFIYIRKNKAQIKSTASLYVLKDMGTLWPMLFIFIVIPRRLRDWIYSTIARNRYKLFGKKDECMLPRPEWRERFLG
ncbi:MAG TPA: DCC1-like thiol-disulfide oxidoreductase family protein [Parasegetibacter sp.]